MEGGEVLMTVESVGRELWSEAEESWEVGGKGWVEGVPGKEEGGERGLEEGGEEGGRRGVAKVKAREPEEESHGGAWRNRVRCLANEGEGRDSCEGRTAPVRNRRRTYRPCSRIRAHPEDHIPHSTPRSRVPCNATRRQQQEPSLDRSTSQGKAVIPNGPSRCTNASMFPKTSS